MARVLDPATLPTEPGFYEGWRHSVWQLDYAGQWWFRGYPDSHPTPTQQDRTPADALAYGAPLVRLVPECSDADRG